MFSLKSYLYSRERAKKHAKEELSKRVAYAIRTLFFTTAVRVPSDSLETEVEWYAKVNKTIFDLGIKHIEVKKDTINIWLSHPGVFIGGKGLQFKNIEQSITQEFGRPMKIRLIEDHLDNCLYVTPPSVLMGEY